MTPQTQAETMVPMHEIERMGKILQQLYGEKAVEVADVLMGNHGVSRDHGRATAWAAVSKYLCGQEGFSLNLH